MKRNKRHLLLLYLFMCRTVEPILYQRTKFLASLIIFLLLSTGNSFAQDLIYLRGQDIPIKVKIIDLGKVEIKYQYWPAKDTLFIQSIDKVNVRKIVTQNGKLYEFEQNNKLDSGYFAQQKRFALKFNLLSPVFGYTGISFEHSFAPGHAYEVGLGIIGAGFKRSENPAGLFLRLGYKFIAVSKEVWKEKDKAYLLNGPYIKPEIVLSSYTSTEGRWTTTQASDARGNTYNVYHDENYTAKTASAALLLNVGVQYAISKTFLFDLYIGLGYSVSHHGEKDPKYQYPDNSTEYQFAYLGPIGGIPLALNSGLKIGILLGRTSRSTTQAATR